MSDAKLREMTEAAALAAQATVTALDRLILADRVAKAARLYVGASRRYQGELLVKLEEAVAAWEAGQPS